MAEQKKRPRDLNQLAASVVRDAVEPPVTVIHYKPEQHQQVYKSTVTTQGSRGRSKEA